MAQYLDGGEVALHLTAGQWEDLRQHVEDLAPEEACGLLAGSATQVLKSYPVTNILHSPVRYRMDPAEQLKVFLEIEQNGWELVGIYHSHPMGPDHPSLTDLQEAYYPDVVFLILFPDAGTWRGRAFRIGEGESHEVVVRIGVPGRD